MANNHTNSKAIVLLVVVFLLGIALGVLGTYVASGRVWGARVQDRGAHGQPTRAVERLTRELNLTPDQQDKLGKILADMQARFDAIHQQMAPQFDQVRHQAREQIRAILTPEQRPKFEDFLRRIDEERRKRSGH